MDPTFTTFPVASTAKASRNRIVLGLTNAQQRQDEKISAREAKQAKLENEIKDATEFLASIREKLTTKQAVSGLRIAALNKVYLAVFGRDRGNIHTNLSSSSKFRVNYLKRMNGRYCTTVGALVTTRDAD